jgi:cyclase
VIYAGSQSVVISLDFKKNILGIYDLYIKSGTIKVDLSLDKILNKIKALNVGEVIINLINKDGSMNGYDLEIISIISKMIDIPLIANSGAKDINDFKLALDQGAHSVAATSMFVYYGKLKAVLITFPSEKSLSAILGNELL